LSYKYRIIKGPETPNCTGCKYIAHSLNSAPCKFCFCQRLDSERDYHTGRAAK
jgi:hypothetical protein